MSATQKEIAEVFRRRVEEVGYAKATLDDVARSMKMSKKTIYVHFDGKREIYAYIVERQAAQEKARLAAMLAALPTCAAEVEAAVRIVIDMGRRHVEETEREEWLRAVRGRRGRVPQGQRRPPPRARAGRHGLRRVRRRATRRSSSTWSPRWSSSTCCVVREDPSYDRDEELLARIIRFIG